MALTRQDLLLPRLVGERELPAICPKCRRETATQIIEIWEGELAVRLDADDKGGYFGDHPWEFGHGYVEYHSQRVEELARIECASCGKEAHQDPDYADDTFQETCGLWIPAIEQAYHEWIEYLSHNPRHLHELNPREFEKLLDAIFRNQGFQSELGPRWDDGGVDLRLLKKDELGVMLTLVQAKRYRVDMPIRLEAIQALSGAVDAERAHRGLFVTTSYYFPGAKKWAKEKSRRIELADSSDVTRWCRDIVRRRCG